MGVAQSRKVTIIAHKGSPQYQVRRRDIKFAFTLIFLNLTFLILNLPTRLADALNFNRYFLVNPLGYYIILLLINLLYNLQFSSSFYIQLAVNNLVRKEFLDIFKYLYERIRCGQSR